MSTTVPFSGLERTPPASAERVQDRSTTRQLTTPVAGRRRGGRNTDDALLTPSGRRGSPKDLRVQGAPADASGRTWGSVVSQDNADSRREDATRIAV